MQFGYRFAERRLEWCLAIYTVLIGTILTFRPDGLVAMYATSGTLSIVPEIVWGLAYLTTGTLHTSYLCSTREGWTSLVGRLVALVINSQIFVALGLAIFVVNPWYLSAWTYFSLGFGFCGVAIYSAVQEMSAKYRAMRTN